MSTLSPSVWASYFEELLDVDTLRQRATVRVSPLTELTSLPLELACERLESALKTVFYPTAQCMSVLQRLVGAAHAHCLVRYPNTRSFLDGVYARQPPLPDFAWPICLTGLAGIGKTELLKALGRVYGSGHSVVADPEHAPFKILGHWLVTVQARSSPKDVLRSLARDDGTPAQLVEQSRKLAFRDGIALLEADEFQFATGSDKASAQVAQMLLSLGYVGIPFVFAANYSLIYRLQRRPGEEQHRLLSNPIVLLPDAASSIDWRNTLAAQRSVAPENFIFDPEKDAETLHAYCSGRKRAMAKLLLLAFRAEYRRGGKVGPDAIHRAYLSSEYAGFREETEILTTQAIQNRAHPKRKDLWCPIPLAPNAAVAFLEAAISAQEESQAQAELTAALSPEERRKAAKMKRGLQKGAAAPGQVVPLPKKSPPTADDLKRNAGLFRDHL